MVCAVQNDGGEIGGRGAVEGHLEEREGRGQEGFVLNNTLMVPDYLHSLIGDSWGQNCWRWGGFVGNSCARGVRDHHVMMRCDEWVLFAICNCHQGFWWLLGTGVQQDIKLALGNSASHEGWWVG